MTVESAQFLRSMARKYIWWKTPDEALMAPERIVSQVMKIGLFEDVQKLSDLVGDDFLRQRIEQAEPGDFDERSWEYWHHRLHPAGLKRVPPLPRRVFAE